MYKKFFGLTRCPFEVSPDPYFLLPTHQHREALAAIVYGVLQRKGFMVLTGEAGTGKTLLVRCLLEMLRARGVASANVFNPTLLPHEFLSYIAGDLGLPKPGQENKGELLLRLYNYLIARQRAKQTTVLIADEAQNMDAALLEEIRLLTNLETSEHKLLQIVLVGQPELDEKMDSPELRQLKQRISVRCNLEALPRVETEEYIWRRLQKAGTNYDAVHIFPPATVGKIHSYSKGIPRLINTICENALLNAYARQSGTVTENIIEDVAKDLRLQVTSNSSSALHPAPFVDSQSLATSLLALASFIERAGYRAPSHPAAPAHTQIERFKVV